MEQKNIFGLDFGTSNTAISTIINSNLKPILFNNKATIPTALFYYANINQYFTSYGQNALEKFEDGDVGRCFRSIKSSLGTELFKDKFRIGRFVKSFEDVISDFMNHTLTTAKQQTNSDIKGLVIGRPVHFIDDNPAQDKIAENQLSNIIKNLGIKNFCFQYEPIAAALNYEQNIYKQSLAMVVDLGGGTSDFSIIKVCKNYTKKADRKDDILATHGIHIGGNDIDSSLNMSHIMPYFGSESIYKQTNSKINQTLFTNMTLWHKIHLLSETKHLSFLKNIPYILQDSSKFEKFIKLIESNNGYILANMVEKAKIELTSKQTAQLNLNNIEKNLNIDISQSQFNSYMRNLINKLDKAIDDTLLLANITNNDVDYLLFTGGTSLIPAIYNHIKSKFTKSEIINNNTFLSVSNGLTIDSYNKFY